MRGRVIVSDIKTDVIGKENTTPLNFRVVSSVYTISKRTAPKLCSPKLARHDKTDFDVDFGWLSS